MARRFVRTPSGDVRIKEDPNIHFGELHEIENPSSRQFATDVQIIKKLKVCAFIRSYVPGEFAGMGVQDDIDMSTVKWVFVIAAPTPDHLVEHLRPLAGQGGVAIFDKLHGKPIHARVLLTDKQAQKIRNSMGNEGTAFYNLENGRIEEE